MTTYHIGTESEREYTKTTAVAARFPKWRLVTQCGEDQVIEVFRAMEEQVFAFTCYARNIRGVTAVELYIDRSGQWKPYLMMS